MELLVTFGTAAAQRASTPRHRHRIHVDLDTASVEDVASYAEVTAASINVIVSTWSALRRVALPLRLIGPTKNMRVRVLDEPLPDHLRPSVWPGVTGRIVEFSCRSDPETGTTLHLRLTRPAPSHHVIGFFSQVEPGLLVSPFRVAVTHRDLEPFALGNPAARYGGVDDAVIAGGVEVPRTEVVLTQAGGGLGPGSVWTPPDDPRPHLSLAGATTTGDDAVAGAFVFPPVDTTVVKPSGYHHGECTTVARLEVGLDGDASIVDSNGHLLVNVPRCAPLSHTDVKAVRHCLYIASTGGDDHPIAEASVLCQLAAAGVPILVPHLQTPLRTLLGREVADAVETVGLPDMEDSLLREAASVRLRRSALRVHGLGPRLRALASHLNIATAVPSVSVVLVTRRPRRLATAVEQVRQQTYPNVQLVVGLHGTGFDDAEVADAMSTLPFASAVVRVDGDVPFGEALNRVSDRCDGRVLTKWDDDDLYGSEHIWDLVLAADYSGASVVGKAAEFTLVAQSDTTVRRNRRGGERYTSHVAGGTIMLRRETLQAIGGWRRQPRYVDDALLGQVRDFGGDVYRTHGFGYVLVRHDEGHTWEPGPEYFLRGDAPRWSAGSHLQQVALEQRW